jgi:integrase
LIGIRWSDLDLAAARLQVARQRVKGGGKVTMGAPKTRKGRRTIALDPATVAALRAHRLVQLGERLAAGPGYLDDDLVFCHEDGRPFDPDGITQRFARHVREANLPRIRLHDVRHSYATASLRAGCH